MPSTAEQPELLCNVLPTKPVIAWQYTPPPVILIPQCFMLTRLSIEKKTNKRNKQKPQQPHNEKQKNKQQKL